MDPAIIQPTGFSLPALSIIVTTTNEVTCTRINAYLGVMRGLVVRTPNIGASILGGLKSLMGGQHQIVRQGM